MKIKLSVQTKGIIAYQNTYPANFAGIQDIAEAIVAVKTEHTHLYITEMWFEGIHISIINLENNLPEDLRFESSHAHIGLLFCLDGSLIATNETEQNFLSLTRNEQNLNLGKVNSLTLRVQEKTSYVYIQLTEAYFQKAMGCEFEHNALLPLREPISPEINSILQSLSLDNHSGRLKRLFVEARILDLIVIHSNQKPDKQRILLKEEDLKKIIYARQLVERDLQRPSSLIELSRKAGINDFKLKKGFKALTGHTVFGYLYKIRMEKAHYYLSKEKRAVNEVAFLVGYKNAQHFIAAFKKQYEVLPGSLNKH
ncbi:helix-turn-helix transcriptional regulator [Pedobacter soli]|uniref:Transcriptional regulator, AraC family n=1 Tax=Pedobacter soli TaxID=390242 RepID=A0A1G6IPR5_9SPHI|nr:AraC family transcriptional regulator [Pedobacter soli]SDC08433.1 transcriptional regulator, AraC family [Pedobacter soli]